MINCEEVKSIIEFSLNAKSTFRYGIFNPVLSKNNRPLISGLVTFPAKLAVPETSPLIFEITEPPSGLNAAISNLSSRTSKLRMVSLF